MPPMLRHALAASGLLTHCKLSNTKPRAVGVQNFILNACSLFKYARVSSVSFALKAGMS